MSTASCPCRGKKAVLLHWKGTPDAAPTPACECTVAEFIRRHGKPLNFTVTKPRQVEGETFLARRQFLAKP